MNSQKQNRHSLMAKGILVLLSILILIFIITFAWFTVANPDADATGFSTKIDVAGDFEYAIGFYNNGTGGDYKITPFTKKTEALNLERLQANDGVTYNLLHDYKPIDITGDGATLIRPAMSYGNSQINTTSNDYNIAEPNVQYISFDLFFRSSVPRLPIKLGDGSWAKGGCEIKGLDYSGASSSADFNKSTYGNFSKDAIVGAVRIAFVPYTLEQEATDDHEAVAGLNADNIQTLTPQYLEKSASLLWLPRPDLKLNPTDGTSGWTITTGASATNATYTLSSAQGAPTYHNNTHTYYGIFNSSVGRNIVEYNPTVTPATLTQSSQEFTEISDSVKIGNDYYTKVNVRIWVEGTDIESRRATSGGKFEVNFKFTTI